MKLHSYKQISRIFLRKNAFRRLRRLTSCAFTTRIFHLRQAEAKTGFRVGDDYRTQVFFKIKKRVRLYKNKPADPKDKEEFNAMKDVVQKRLRQAN